MGLSMVLIDDWESKEVSKYWGFIGDQKMMEGQFGSINLWGLCRAPCKSLVLEVTGLAVSNPGLDGQPPARVALSGLYQLYIVTSLIYPFALCCVSVCLPFSPLSLSSPLAWEGYMHMYDSWITSHTEHIHQPPYSPIKYQCPCWCLRDASFAYQQFQ